MSRILEFVFPAPRVYDNESRTTLVTQNTSSKWKRWSEKKIKNKLKQSLSEWSVPESDLILNQGSVVFTIHRHNKRRMDADSIAPVGKWTVDFLVEQNWFKDDDKIIFIYKPSMYDKSLKETMIRCEVYDEHII